MPVIAVNISLCCDCFFGFCSLFRTIKSSAVAVVFNLSVRQQACPLLETKDTTESIENQKYFRPSESFKIELPNNIDTVNLRFKNEAEYDSTNTRLIEARRKE